MRRNPYFVLRELAGIPYLLPYGQSIASHHRGMKLNETGVFLWELLENEKPEKELISLCAADFGASEEELPELEKDLKAFLAELVRLGAVLPDGDPVSVNAPYVKALEIAGLQLHLEGLSEVFSERFDPFAQARDPRKECPNDIPCMAMRVTALAGICPYQNPGHAILRNSMMSVLDCGSYFEIHFHANQFVKECILKKDASHAIFYYRTSQSQMQNDVVLSAIRADDAEPSVKEELFHGIREAFLYLAGLHGMVALHSTSILYEGKAWLFSGRSGMGKSTHANLWKESFGTPVLNGDLNLIGTQDGKPVIYGIPWCGTSEISDVETHSLGGITLLDRAPNNFITELKPDQQLLLVDQRLISHSWNLELFDQNLNVIKKIAPEILICKLNCTKDPEAAAVMRGRIDRYLDQAR